MRPKRDWEELVCAKLAGLAIEPRERRDRKSTRLNSSHRCISYAVFCSVRCPFFLSFPTRRSSDLWLSWVVAPGAALLIGALPIQILRAREVNSLRVADA